MDSMFQTSPGKAAVDGDWNTLAHTQCRSSGKPVWWTSSFHETSCIDSVTIVPAQFPFNAQSARRMNNLAVYVVDRGSKQFCGRLDTDKYLSVEINGESYIYYHISCSSVHCGEALELRLEESARVVCIHVTEIYAYKSPSTSGVKCFDGMYS